MLSKQKLVGFFPKLLWWVEFCYSGAIEVSKLQREGFIWAIRPLFRVGNEAVFKDQTGNVRSSQVKADREVMSLANWSTHTPPRGVLVKMFKVPCRPNKIHSYRPSAAHMGLRPCKVMEDQRSILNRMYGRDRLRVIFQQGYLDAMQREDGRGI